MPVDHSTICRWVQKFAPEIEKRLRWQWRRPRSTSWRVDETYVKVRDKWAYVYRALDKEENTIDFYLSPTRNGKAAIFKLTQDIRREARIVERALVGEQLDLQLQPA